MTHARKIRLRTMVQLLSALLAAEETALPLLKSIRQVDAAALEKLMAERLQTACATPCADGAASDLRSFALVTDISLGLTLAGAAVGVIFLLVDAEAYEEPSVAVTPWADPSGGGVVTRGRF